MPLMPLMQTELDATRPSADHRRIEGRSKAVLERGRCSEPAPVGELPAKPQGMQMTKTLSVFKQKSLRWAAVLTLVACSSAQPPFVSRVGAVDIVLQNTSDALDVFFDPNQDGEALRSFDAKAVSARDRAELTIEWQAVPALAAKGGDFLEKKVFTKAMEEKKWPKDVPPSALEETFVLGVHLGVQRFLSKDQE
jgi:hypothetical protein